VEEIKALGGEAAFCQADVSKEADVKNMVQFTINKYGTLDHACNNAGVVPPNKKFTEMTEADFDYVVDIDLKGVFLSLKYELEYMEKVQKGTIVNTTSIAGIIADPGMAPYVAAKHGVIGLTKAAGIEYIKQGIRVNAIAPGFTETPMTDGWLVDPEFRAVIEGNTPINRPAKPAEMVGTILFLSSDESSYAAGQVFVIDGGQIARG
jgi:NAD(P)-dependent dehydrogenase (short-subunit alcohol dehydrogenase family)